MKVRRHLGGQTQRHCGRYTESMQGIHFVTDAQGRKVAVQIDLEQHGELWEDFYDAFTLDERRDEPRESFEAVEERLVREGKLRG